MSAVLWRNISAIFFILTSISIVIIILGMINPCWVIRWGNLEKRTRSKVFILYSGIAVVLCGVFFITRQEAGHIFQLELQARQTTKPTISSQPVLPSRSNASGSSSNVAPTTKKPRLVIQEGWTWQNDEMDITHIKGRVKNVGDVNVTYFKITAEYMDKAGNILDTDTAFDSTVIKPGSQQGFDIMKARDPQYAKVKIRIDKVESE